MTTGTSPVHGGTDRTAAARDVADRMATAATTWLEALDTEQKASAHWAAPGSDTETEAERLRWYYTPTDHGGLPISGQTPAQQSLAMQVLSAGLSAPAHVTISAVMDL